MALAAQQRKEYFSYHDYLQWDEERWEIIDGVVYDMSPAPSRWHQKISGDLFAKIHAQLADSPCEVYHAPLDVRLTEIANAEDDDITTVVQPDIVVVCEQEKLDDRGCIGAPDLVVEILSPATASKDLKVKRDLYEKHGVKEYWIVHPLDKFFMVYTLDENRLYQKSAIFTEDDIISSSAVAPVRIQLEDIFGKVATKNTTSPPKQAQ